MKEKIFRYGTFLVCLLGMLSAFGPFVTDMYLPALPQLQAYFSTDASMVQLSLSIGILLLIGSFIMRESLAPENRSPDGIVRTFATFGKIVRNRRFVCLLLQYGFLRQCADACGDASWSIVCDLRTADGCLVGM